MERSLRRIQIFQVMLKNLFKTKIYSQDYFVGEEGGEGEGKS